MAEDTGKDKDKGKGKPWVVEQARRDVKAAELALKNARTEVTKQAARDKLKEARANLNRLQRVGEKTREARSGVREARAAVAEAKKTPGKADDRAAQKQLDEAKEAASDARSRRGRVRTKIREEMYSEWGPMVAEAIREFPELREFFQQAIAGRWDEKKQRLELNKPDRPWSDWYRNKSREWRSGFERQYGENSTPGTWDSDLKVARDAIRDAARIEGVKLSDEDLERFARRYWYSDWNTNKRSLTVFMQGAAKRQRKEESETKYETVINPVTGKPEQSRIPKPGENSIDTRYADRNKLIAQLEKIADDYGVKLNADTVAKWADRIRDPNRNVENVEMTRFMESIVQRSRSRYGVFGDQITADMSLRDLGSGYIDELTGMLELNPDDVRLGRRDMDPLLMEAFTNVDRETGKPSMIPLWEFRKRIRADERWQFTDNARNTYMSAASGFARALGLAG